MAGEIVIAGSLAQKPLRGGHTWVLLQYVLGLKKLGWSVLFLDRLEPEMCVDDEGRPAAAGESLNLRYFVDVMRGFGLERSCALILGENGSAAGGATAFGLGRGEVLARVREAELLLNVMGYLDDEEILAAARRRVFLDIDPGFGQMWRELGWADVFSGHDDLVTIGGNIGREGCTIPDCGLTWITTSQPIVLDLWPARPPGDGPFTSVGTWRGRYAPIEYAGETYGLRVHEFRKFAGLPAQTGASFELALDIDEAEQRDLTLLETSGWRLVDPLEVASNPWSYQCYIARSGAEFMVAKDVYVRSRSGWFSDRSICYLASGRPAIVQDTGLEDLYPTGDGLLVFRDFEEARAAVAEVSRDRRHHAAAARRVAEECFDSDRVLGRLLDRLGVRARD
ncbi:MAG: glycosyltransferase family protein [Thermoanaerobaculia bacterium]